MALRQRDTSFGQGVYYAADDYIGIGRRIVILFVDALVLAMLLGILVVAWIVIRGWPPILLTILIFSVAWLYVVFFKQSPRRTVGLWLTGCRVVNLQGNKPSLYALTVRSLLWMFGPFNLLFDILWCGLDDDKQTLRDRFAETCLIKDSATPIGTGEIHLTYFDIGTFNLAYPRVVHPKPKSEKPTA